MHSVHTTEHKYDSTPQLSMHILRIKDMAGLEEKAMEIAASDI